MTAVIGIAAGVVMGAVYGFAVFHNPILYVNFLLTGAFGFAIGWVVSWGVTAFHIRNRAIAVILALVVFGAAYAVNWAVYVPTVRAHFSSGSSSFDIPLIFEEAVWFIQHPRATLEWIEVIKENGVWSITTPGSRQPGIPMSGIFLALIWLVEAVIIAFLAVTLPHEAAGKPFSERQGRWIPQKVLPGRIAFVKNTDEFLNAFVRGDFSALFTPLAAAAVSDSAAIEDEYEDDDDEYEDEDEIDSDDALQYATVTLYADSFEPYVSVQNVSRSGVADQAVEQPKKPSGGILKKIWGWVKSWFTSSSDDEENLSITDVVQYLKISPNVAQNISNALGVEKR